MKSRGFSLPELVIVVAIMGILMASVAPSIKDWVVNTRIRNAATALETGLQLTKQEALKRNQSVTFWLVNASSSTNFTTIDDACSLSSTGGSWVISVKNPAASGKCKEPKSSDGDYATRLNTDPIWVASHAVGDGARDVTFVAKASDKTTSVSCLVFSGLGRVTTSSSCAASIGRIDIKSSIDSTSYRSLCLEVNGGTVKVCDPAVTDSSDPRICANACKNP